MEVILDTPPARGPLSGICACLSRLNTTHLVVLGIDLPRMNLEHLHMLLSLATSGRSLFPLNRNYFEPLCAIYAKSAAPFASANSDGSLQHLAQQLLREDLAITHPLSVEEQSLYFNLNTAEDLKTL